MNEKNLTNSVDPTQVLKPFYDKIAHELAEVKQVTAVINALQQSNKAIPIVHLQTLHEKLSHLELAYDYLKQHIQRESKWVVKSKKMKTLIMAQNDHISRIERENKDIFTNGQQVVVAKPMPASILKKPQAPEQTPKRQTTPVRARTPIVLQKQQMPNDDKCGGR